MALKIEDRVLLTVFTGNVEIFIGRGDMHDFDIEQDARQPALKVTLKDENGAPIIVTGATFTMWKWKTGEIKINAAAMGLDTDGSDGKVNYVWVVGDTDTTGLFCGRVTATISGGATQPVIEKILINVHRKPGG